MSDRLKAVKWDWPLMLYHGECKHAQLERGPDYPLRYGSHQTRVCKDCKAWRTQDHHGNSISPFYSDDIDQVISRANEEAEEQ